ncbi:MAG: peptide chain release factor N(5)-glutamine methyltransferase [Gammaproteobacteria bacterium]|nr:peptide chain release factor N(5)-glutamine methyltransferase [Gammaproteobacteria bacterium]
MMNLKEAVEYAATTLTSISASAKLDAQMLICHACNIEQTKIITYPEQTLNEQQLELFTSALNRRKNGEPLAYITGRKEFWSLEFTVSERVLIPRPETELLIELTLNEVSNTKAPRILDLGTGSGAISISVAKEREDAKIVATDISSQALEIAKKNAEKHNAEITFIKSSWYENLAEEIFDAIICNPPYIAKDDPDLDKHVYQHEPGKALISDENGLKDLELVIAGAKEYLSSTGYLAVEHGFQQAKKVQQLFDQHGFMSIQTHKDLTGLDRATTGHT